jgi:hypothetical protein
MRKLFTATALLIPWACGSVLAADTLFVTSGAPGGGDGRSWDAPFATVQTAIAKATSGDEVWVSAGDYFVGSEGLNLPSGLRLYGGFRGFEVSREARDPRANRTRIVARPDASPIITLTQASAYTVIDGFVVYGASNRALLIDGGAPLIRNCCFEQNAASHGGAILVVRSDSARISFCEFKENRASVHGGAIAVIEDVPSRSSMLSIEHSFFMQNTATGSGGAVCILGTSIPVTISNCVFYENRAENSAGALLSADAHCSVSMSTFVKNSSGSVFVSARTIEVVASGSFDMRNSLIWNGQASTKRHVLIRNYDWATVQLQVRANLIEGDSLVGQWWSDPRFVDIHSPSGPDGLLGTSDDGLRLDPDSPRLNAAVANLKELQVSSDITGKPRASQGIADLGAYERQRDEYAADEVVTERLRRGDVILLFRHAITDPSKTTTGPGGLCAGELNLSQAGRGQAREIGRFVAEFCPPPSMSISGTSCRTWETAQFVAGFSEQFVEWDGGFDVRSRDVRIQHLSMGVGRRPRVIVTDEDVILAHVDLAVGEVKEGDVVILEPYGTSYRVLSHFSSETWTKIPLLARSTDVSASPVSRSATIRAYPNPAADVVTFSVAESSDLRLYTMHGDLVWNGTVDASATVDVSSFAPGVYVASTRDGSATLLIISATP